MKRSLKILVLSFSMALVVSCQAAISPTPNPSATAPASTEAFTATVEPTSTSTPAPILENTPTASSTPDPEVCEKEPSGKAVEWWASSKKKEGAVSKSLDEWVVFLKAYGFKDLVWSYEIDWSDGGIPSVFLIKTGDSTDLPISLSSLNEAAGRYDGKVVAKEVTNGKSLIGYTLMICGK